MGFTNTPPAAKITNDNGISSQADATAVNQVGAWYAYADSSGRWSVLRYYQAGASIVQGNFLQVNTSSHNFIQMTVANVELGNKSKGIAAADVSNTSYYSFCYVAGYCPAAMFPSVSSTGVAYRLSTSIAGRAKGMYNVSTGFNSAPKNVENVIIALNSVSDSGTILNSGTLMGWLL